MKKNFLYSIVVLCICLFAACSQEEIMDEAGQQAGKQVSLTVDVPGGVMTRALPTEQDHKLRCIMQVVDKDNKSITGEGMRQVVEVNADKMTFTFTAPEGDYKCLFWADFVTDIKADNVYTTTDLTNITYKKMDNDVFSTKADAFCGYVANGTATITLKRPFAKVSVAPKNASTFAGYNKLTVSYNAPSGFNMVTGAVSSTAQKVTYTKESFNASAGAWFTSFVFAPANVEKLGSDITMKIEGGTDGPKTLTIAANNVPLTPNYEIDGTFDAASGSNVNVEVEFDGSFDKPEVKAPIVGDYFYADGTWGAAITSVGGAEAVGVVFHIENEEEPLDAITNYTGITFEDNKVHGWVVALADVPTANNGGQWTNIDLIAGATVGTIKRNTLAESSSEYVGFFNSNQLTNATTTEITFNANTNCKNHTPTITSGVKATGWYLPASGQLVKLADATVQEKLGENKIAEAVGTEKTNHKIYLSSTIIIGSADATVVGGVQFNTDAIGGGANPHLYGTVKGQKAVNGYNVRPVLTF